MALDLSCLAVLPRTRSEMERRGATFEDVNELCRVHGEGYSMECANCMGCSKVDVQSDSVVRSKSMVWRCIIQKMIDSSSVVILSTSASSWRSLDMFPWVVSLSVVSKPKISLYPFLMAKVRFFFRCFFFDRRRRRSSSFEVSTCSRPCSVGI